MPTAARSLYRKAIQRLVSLTGFDLGVPYYYRYHSSVAGAGEPGLAAGAFGNVTAMYVRGIPPTGETGVIRAHGSGEGGGWLHYVGEGQVWGYYDTTIGTKYTLRPLDVGRVLVLLTRLSSGPTTLDTWVNKQRLASVARTAAFTPSPYRHAVGNASPEGSALPSRYVDFVASLDFRGSPTDAQIEALFDAIRALGGDMPSTMAGATVTHRHSARASTAFDTVANGAAGPAALSDQVTVNVADRLDPYNGTPTVRVKTVQEGRHALALGNFSERRYLESTGVGIQGSATGLTVLVALRAVNAAGAGFVVNAYGPSVDTGWTIYQNGPGDGMLRFYAYGMGDLSICRLTEAMADTLVAITWDGTTWRLYANAVQTNSFAMGFTRNTTGKMRVGIATHGGGPTDAVVSAVAGCDQGLTAAEVAAVFANWERTGRLALPAGKTNPHVYDLTFDLLDASPQGSIPGVFLDRAGTDHLRVLGAMHVNQGGLRAFFSQFFTTSSAATGLAGSASAWSGEVLIRPVQPSTTNNETIFSNTGAASNGLQLRISAGSLFLQAVFGNGSGTVSLTAPTALTSGALTHVAWTFDGTSARLYVNGTLAAGPTAVAYVAGSQPTKLGTLYAEGTGYNLENSTHYGASGSNTVAWSAAEVSAASASALATGKLVGVAAKTDRRWSIPDDIAEAGGGVPSTLKERSGVAASAMNLVGSGLASSRRVERALGYATTPAMIGARAWSAANYFMGAMTGFAHSATLPYWFVVALIVHARAGNAFQSITPKTSSNGYQGLNLYASSTLSSIVFTHGIGTGTVAAPTYSIADADLNKPLLLGYQWTGSAVQAFAHRARNGGDSAAATFTPYTGSLAIGRNPSAAGNELSDNVTVLGLMGGVGSLALSEYLTAHDDFYANDDLVAVPGKTARLYSLRRTVLASGGTLGAIADAMNSGETLAITGAPAVSRNYAHAS